MISTDIKPQSTLVARVLTVLYWVFMAVAVAMTVTGMVTHDMRCVAGAVAAAASAFFAASAIPGDQQGSGA